MLCEDAVSRTSAQVDCEFSQRKHISSGVTEVEKTQVRQAPDEHGCESISVNAVL